MQDVNKITGLVFDVQHFCVHDGPGIRTTVFLKGCPLSCAWCHNPEGMQCRNSLRFFEQKCIGCNACAKVCTNGAQPLLGEYVPDSCTACFACSKVCPSGARVAAAREYTAKEIADKVLGQKIFYRENGGVTVSGGEALIQPEFTAAILKICKEQGIGTAVDTCGYVPWRNIEMTLPYTDVYLWDIKACDPETHKRGCGVYNGLIIENLEKLDRLGKKISIRVPVIGGFNDNQKEMQDICRLILNKKSVYEVVLMPYHSLGQEKYKTIGLEAPIWEGAEILPQRLEGFKKIFKDNGINVK